MGELSDAMPANVLLVRIGKVQAYVSLGDSIEQALRYLEHAEAWEEYRSRLAKSMRQYLG